MFIPNTKADFYIRSANADNFGRHHFTLKAGVPCSVIYLNVGTEKSSVRADTSGSRGQAEQFQGDARLLFPRKFVVKAGDVVFKDDLWLEVIEVEPRRNILGQIDHIKVELRKSKAVSV